MGMSPGLRPLIQAIMSLYAWLTARRLFLLLLFISIFTMAVRVPADSDTFWHLRSGQFILETRSIPRHDPFSHTRLGEEWIDHGWLPQAGMYLAFRHFGYGALALGVALCVTLAFGLVFLQAEPSSSDLGFYTAAFATLLGAITSGVGWVARPQMVTFLFTALFGYLLHLHKRGRNLLWLLPPLFVVWVNSHGGFIVGFVLLGCHLMGEALHHCLRRSEAHASPVQRMRVMLGAALASVPALLVNPNSYRMLLYPFRTVSMGALQKYIQEWASPDFHQLYQQPFLWMLFLLVAAFALAGRKADFTDLVLVIVFGYMALMAGRNIALFALVTAPLLARYGEAALRSLGLAWRAGRVAFSPRLVALNWALLLLALVGCGLKVRLPLTAEANLEAQREFFPVDAVRFVEEFGPPREMFNSYNWGGYLLWHLYPRYRVFIDGRTDLYDDPFIQDYLRVVRAEPGWDEVLRRYNVRFVLVERTCPLVAVLKHTEGWHCVYEDARAAVCVREAR